MKPLSALDRDEARALHGVFFDLDDTVLTHGLLTREAFAAIWSLHDAGLKLVAVTGRPSGWGEVVARQWPIDGAITENGAVFLVREDRGVRVITDGDVTERRVRLDAIARDVAQKLPHVMLSDDTHARRTDLAWDIGERVKLPPADVEALAKIVVSHGARTTRSTVHLHASYERDDKASGAVRFACTRFAADAGSTLSRYAFCGDSPNDAACFAAFKTTFGVANVRAFASQLTVTPRYVATEKRGAGFAEIAKAILSAR